MANRALRERLAQDIGLWLADGLISKSTYDLLRERYSAREFGIANAIKSLGIAGGLIAFFGLLGMVAAFSNSRAVAASMLLATGAAMTGAGIRLSTDKLGRYPTSSQAILMIGVIMFALGVGVGIDQISTNMPVHEIAFFTGALVLLPLGIVAYRYKNTFLLVMALLGFFHWVGTWTSMVGRSTYELEIDDPRWMCLAATAAVIVGIYHERFWRNQTGRFYQVYETIGLIYLNLSLLILTISWSPERETAVWIAVWFGMAVLQIICGAGLHNSLLTGFGITAFAVNVYTRYFEEFWNRMHAGAFFLVGGASLFIAGFLCEVALRRSQPRIR